MGVVEDLADGLARDVIEAAEEIGDPNLIDEVAKMLLSTSQTTQEAFMTAVRVRLAERRARQFLERHMAKARAAGPRERVDLSERRIMNTPDDSSGGGH